MENKKKTLILMIIAVTVFITLIVGATYAYFSVQMGNTTANTTITAQTEGGGSIILTTPVTNLKLNLLGNEMDEKNKTKAYYAVKQDATEDYTTDEASGTHDIAKIVLESNSEDISYSCNANVNITLDIESEKNMGAALQQDDLLLSVLGYDDIDLYELQSTNGKKTIPVSFIIKQGEEKFLKLYAKLINRDDNQNYLADKTLSIQVETKDLQCEIVKPFVPEDYVSDDKVLANESYLIYHDGEGTYGEYEAGDYSYRFSGNNPDNYVCLDGNNNATGPCNDIKKLYRVIGWFPKDGNTSEYQMKLIKSEYITTTELGGGLASSKVSQPSYNDFTKRVENNETVDGFLWSGASSINYNNWIKSTLNKTLNNPSGTYLTSLSKYIGLIEDTKWYIGGNEDDKIREQSSMKAAYENELGTNKLKEGSQSCVNDSTKTVQCTEDLLYQENKVGLMYATEYGYASAPSNWNSRLYSYNNTNNRSANWLYNGVYEWTLSHKAGSTRDAFIVSSYGYVFLNNVYYDRDGVRPVLVLKSNATVKSGDGSKNKPWRINLQSS